MKFVRPCRPSAYSEPKEPSSVLKGGSRPMSAVMNAVMNQFLRGCGASVLRPIRNEPAGLIGGLV